MERQDFEDSLKKAFEKAEVPPSGNVWTNIELDLEKAKGTTLKKRLAYFQMLAAAAIIFSLGLGVGVFIMKNSYEESTSRLLAEQQQQQKQQQSASQSETRIAEPPSTSSVANLGASNVAQQEGGLKPQESVGGSNEYFVERDRNKLTESDSFVAANDIVENSSEGEQSGFFGADRDGSLADMNVAMPPIVEFQKIKLTVPSKATPEVDPIQLMLAKLDQREKELQAAKASKDKRSTDNERLWTSVGFAAGSFNSVNAGVSNRQSTAAFAQNSSIANKEAKASGVAYSIGANIGTKLSERWVFQGGVNYLTQSSDYTAQSAVVASADFTSFRPASINELEKLTIGDVPAEEKVVATAPYNVNNSLRYLSIPMQAGYMLINKNFGLQLNAGVATDLFLQNTVSAEGGNLDKSTQGIGDHSPYRSVNLSGLAGTELSYRFSRNYRVALNPGLRYPLNSIYRSEVDIKSSPITFDIGLRFRYIFK